MEIINIMGAHLGPSMRIFLLSALFCYALTGCAYLGKTYNNPKPARETRERYLSYHSDLDHKTRGLIRNGLINEDMSKEEARASWGKPDSINKTSKFGADEIWYYWDKPI